MARGRAQTDTLTTALSRLLLKEVLPDLRERSKQPAVLRELEAQHRQEREKKATGAVFLEWRDQLLDQVGAAWVLSCVFVRTLEDRNLLDRRRLALREGQDSEELFYQLAPHLGPREYLLTVFREVSRLPGAEDLLGTRHNAAWRLGVSQTIAQKLLEFFRATDEQGELRWTFTDTDTRFLGDLYQDLSEAVRDRYALLQTPEFVEEFILDRTLEPAIAEFGLETVQVLDPTCGSGHFLLGAFKRLFDKRLAAAPGASRTTAALAALGQVHGIDLNPYAVAIARFRLTLAFLEAVGAGKLRAAPQNLGVSLAVADSLLIEGGGSIGGGKGTAGHFGELFGAADTAWGAQFSIFALEDPDEARRILRRRYQVVVGNPPYITCKDPVLREVYRGMYASAGGKYALSAPFAERLFQLASEQGFVGQITSNSFMKREFGKALVEDVLPHLDLNEIIDTSGAYIPGHSTPTVILIGRNRPPVGGSVRAVQGKRGEPSTPANPAVGRVWTSILAGVEGHGYEDEFVSSANLDRTALGQHPWSLSGGGADDLKRQLDESAVHVLASMVQDIGPASFPGTDDAFVLPYGAAVREGAPPEFVRPFVTGESLRDWTATCQDHAIAPYHASTHLLTELADLGQATRHFWRVRTPVLGTLSFGGRTRKQSGDAEWAWYRWIPERYASSLSLTFAFVSTHNQFVLDRGGKVFNRHAPLIKLSARATEDDHLALLGLLNSSVACFWMKQVFYPKATASGDISTEKGKPENNRYEFAATGMGAFPVPLPAKGSIEKWIRHFAGELDRLARDRAATEPSAVVAASVRSSSGLAAALGEAEAKSEGIGNQMVALQEELDWLCYGAYGLLDDPFSVFNPLPVAPEDRPFAWADDRGPDHLALGTAIIYRKRRKIIAENRNLALMETPVYKRLWLGQRGVFGHNSLTYQERAAAAMRTWLLDRLETQAKTAPGESFTLREAAQALQTDPAVQAVAEVLTNTADFDLVRVLSDLALSDAVPHLAALRYSDSGLEKRAAWEHTWDLQRREDAGETLDIPVPPKYGSGDFKSATFWSLRGKLDVPKERFVHFPGAERDDDPSPVLLWAGADHLQRALALAALYHDRQTNEGWPAERLVPLLAGLDELVPWLKQWHDEPDPARGGRRMGEYFARFVEEEARKQGASVADLRAWRPEAKRAGRRKKG